MKKYDIIVYFDADYLCTGSFYDSFEYFSMMQKKSYNVAFVVRVYEGRQTIYNALKAKYKLPEWFNVYIYNRREIQPRIPLSCNILFIPSMASACCFYNDNIQIEHKKMITIMELPMEHGWMSAFEKSRNDVLVLRNNRIFPAPKGYDNWLYNRTLYFDIMKPCRTPAWRVGMLNMVTNHKCYEPEEILNIIKYIRIIDKWVLYTKDLFWEKYKILQSDTIDVRLTPHPDYMDSFSHIIYLPSKRAFDPSPRLLAESKYFNKEVIYWTFDDAPYDGAKYRYIDILSEGLANLVMTENDKIFKIIEEYR